MNNQGGFQNTMEISGIAATQMSPMQGAVKAYSFGDITRVGHMDQNARPQSFNPSEIFFDNNKVGLNPFNGGQQGETFTAVT